ncbi:hypothetical protein SJ05684_b42130 (plasmid) [Sinorhizobium sojae CCBAU 05684]|uniref:Uncharacterized protein n=1 Tax=Sinorhizobium sojae CCBAU 05684 TaxID=716928 RepID=A0A249PHF1_9HYPH|nr:hypothetical protein SJ05684_b42130 [Sinorhizobium sojae CCBAU 05684]
MHAVDEFVLPALPYLLRARQKAVVSQKDVRNLDETVCPP